MTLPSGIRKKHNRIWRELRPFIKRADNSLKYTKEDAVHALSLIDQHKESMVECLNRADNIRAAKAIPPDNTIENELRGMGLL